MSAPSAHLEHDAAGDGEGCGQGRGDAVVAGLARQANVGGASSEWAGLKIEVSKVR